MVLATGMDTLWIMAADALDGGDHQEHCVCHRGDKAEQSRANRRAEAAFPDLRCDKPANAIQPTSTPTRYTVHPHPQVPHSHPLLVAGTPTAGRASVCTRQGDCCSFGTLLLDSPLRGVLRYRLVRGSSRCSTCSCCRHAHGYIIEVHVLYMVRRPPFGQQSPLCTYRPSSAGRDNERFADGRARGRKPATDRLRRDLVSRYGCTMHTLPRATKTRATEVQARAVPVCPFRIGSGVGGCRPQYP